MNLKQIFCNHIWEEKEKTFLKKRQRMWNGGASIEIEDYNTYVVKRHCLKCDKDDIIEEWERTF
jgi:hypothetical protein